MDPHLVGELVDKAIPLLGGLYATWLGFSPRTASDHAEESKTPRLRSLMRVFGPLLVLWGLGSLAMVAVQSRGAEPGGYDRAAVVQGINERLPMMADEVTRMERVEDLGDRLVYHATLLAITSEQGLQPGALDEIAAAARASICADPDQRNFLVTMGPLRNQYAFADGPIAGAFELSVQDCD